MHIAFALGVPTCRYKQEQVNFAFFAGPSFTSGEAKFKGVAPILLVHCYSTCVVTDDSGTMHERMYERGVTTAKLKALGW